MLVLILNKYFVKNVVVKHGEDIIMQMIQKNNYYIIVKHVLMKFLKKMYKYKRDTKRQRVNDVMPVVPFAILYL